MNLLLGVFFLAAPAFQHTVAEPAQPNMLRPVPLEETEALLLVGLEELRAEADLRAAILLLDLNNEQRRSLARIASVIATERETLYQKGLTVLKWQDVAFSAFLDQDLDGGEFEKTTEQSTSRASHTEDELRVELANLTVQYCASAAEVLTPGQLLLLECCQPDDFLTCAASTSVRLPRNPVQLVAVEAVRDMQGIASSSVKRRAEKGARDILKAATSAGSPPWDEEQEYNRIFERLSAAATLPDIAFERAILPLSKGMLPFSDKRYAHEELKRVRGEKHGHVDTFAKMLMVPSAHAVLLGLSEDDSGQRETQVQFQQRTAVSRQLRTDINLVNLANGLHLSNEQLHGLASIASPQTQARAASSNNKDRESNAFDYDDPVQVVRSLRDLNQSLEKGKMMDDRSLRKLGQQVDVLERRLRREEKRASREEGRRSLRLLSPAQQRVLLDYKPCLIPTQDLKNPIRVGQAGNNERSMKVLEQIRGLDDRRYRANRERIAERSLARMEKANGSFPDNLRSQRLNELLELFDEVRSMDDVDFALEGPDLANRIECFDYSSQLKNTLRREDLVAELESRAARLLHSDRFALVAREIASRRSRKGLPEPVNLMDIIPAESCVDGRCAVD